MGRLKSPVKTRVRSIRVKEDIDAELERLRETFGFPNIGELVTESLRLPKAVDGGLSKLRPGSCVGMGHTLDCDDQISYQAGNGLRENSKNKGSKRLDIRNAPLS